jgi:hypothetical protein
MTIRDGKFCQIIEPKKRTVVSTERVCENDLMLAKVLVEIAAVERGVGLSKLAQVRGRGRARDASGDLVAREEPHFDVVARPLHYVHAAADGVEGVAEVVVRTRVDAASGSVGDVAVGIFDLQSISLCILDLGRKSPRTAQSVVLRVPF